MVVIEHLPIFWLLRKLAEIGRQGIQITKIHAGSGTKTPPGLPLIKHAGFKEISRRE
jgi:hypothetical protein